MQKKQSNFISRFWWRIKQAQLADGIEMFKGHEGKYIHAELHINESCIIYVADLFDEEIVVGSNILLGPGLIVNKR